MMHEKDESTTVMVTTDACLLLMPFGVSQTASSKPL